MLISHMPAGYIATKTFNKVKNENISFLKYGVLFSLWPDLDLFYFYLVNKKQTFHHLYFTHLPFVLLIFLFIAIPIKLLNLPQSIKSLYYFFLANWFVHLFLDTITGGIAWLYPFSSKVFVLIDIPATYSNWILSFILHWSFVIELSIVIWSVVLALRANTKVEL